MSFKLDLAPPSQWQDFESLCCDIWRRIWNDPAAQKHGRSGQKQKGVDIFGRRDGTGTEWQGVQCKLKGPGHELDAQDIETEVKAAQGFKPALKRLIVATTARRDTKAQEAARRISALQEAADSFSVALFSWDDILEELHRHPNLLSRYYPQYSTPKWLNTLLSNPTIDVQASKECRKDPVIAFLLKTAGILQGQEKDKAKKPTITLALTCTKDDPAIVRAGIYASDKNNKKFLLEAIDQPADSILSRWIVARSFGISTEWIWRQIPRAPSAARKHVENIFRELIPTHTTLNSLQPSPEIEVGTPRNTPGLRTQDLSAEGKPNLGPIRFAVERQDFLLVEQELRILEDTKIAHEKNAPELQLYNILSGAWRGNLTKLTERLKQASRTVPVEANLRSAFAFLALGQLNAAEILCKNERNRSSLPMCILSETVRLWARAKPTSSSASQILSGELDRISTSASKIVMPPSFWLCLARLALRTGHIGKAEHFLSKVDKVDRQSGDYKQISALTKMKRVSHRRKEFPHRGITHEDRTSLADACAELTAACGKWKEHSVGIRSDLLRDLAIAHELLAVVCEGAERDAQLHAAAVAYEQAASNDYGMARLRANAGRCWLAAREHQNALEAYRLAPSDQMDSLQRSDYAAALLLNGLASEAMETIASLLDQDLAPWQALFNAAIVLQLTDNPELAATALDQASSRGGQSNWRIEALRGFLYQNLSEYDQAEEAYRQSIYYRGRHDHQLHSEYALAFSNGTMRRLRRYLDVCKKFFQQHHAKTDALTLFDIETEQASSDYRARIQDLETAGPTPSDFLIRFLTDSFETSNAINRRTERLHLAMQQRSRLPPSEVIDQINVLASGSELPHIQTKEKTQPSQPDKVRFDWEAQAALAQKELLSLPVRVRLTAQDPSMLGDLSLSRERTKEETEAHRLAIVARRFEINTDTPLRCYNTLAGPEGDGPILYKAYQERVVKQVFGRMRGRAVLADDVGLGKTIEAGLLLMEYRLRRLVRRCLILVPTCDLAEQWHRELEVKLGHNPPFPWRVGRYERGRGHKWETHDTWIATYNAAVRNRETYLNAEWDMVIADEAQHLTNRSNKSYKLLNRMTSSHILLLSATPVHRSIDDFFSLASIVSKGLFPDLRAFRTLFSREALEDENKRAKATQMLSQFVVRNTILRVADQAFTGRRVFKNVTVTLAPFEQEFYKRTIDMILKLGKETQNSQLPLEYYTIAKMSSSSARATLGTLSSMTHKKSARKAQTRHDTQRQQFILDRYKDLKSLWEDKTKPAKVGIVEEIIKEVAPRKILIFVEFLETAKLLEEELGLKAIHGGLPPTSREEILKEFRESETKSAIVATKGLSEGLNLAFCSVLINYDLPWNPMRIEQRIGRIQRIGQHHPEVLIYSLTAEGTIEEDIRDALMRKVDLFRRVVDDIELDLSSITDSRAITSKLRSLLRESISVEDLQERAHRFFTRIMPPAESEDPL